MAPRACKFVSGWRRVVTLNILSLAHEDRRSLEGRTSLLREADIAILCLPDDAAKQSVALAEGSDTRMIDASTAHRSNPDWAYGFGELRAGQKQKIASAQYVSNPGCYSTGAIALINPLIEAGIMLNGLSADDYRNFRL